MKTGETMNKTALKNFAIWARRKLIQDVTLKAEGYGIFPDRIVEKEPQSTPLVEFFDVGLPHLVELTGDRLIQRQNLVRHIEEKAKFSDLPSAFTAVMEEVAYTWFNRLIALRFMEVNDYLPAGVRVLSSSTTGKTIPDMVSTPFKLDFDFTEEEAEEIDLMMDNSRHDDLFRLLFVRQCNALHPILPKLFEQTNHYSELLLNISFVNREGVAYRLISDIKEEDFKEAVEIVGWLYQFYNDERKNEVINIYKGTVCKEDVPAATQLFTTDWVVRYMVDNSLGRYWLERQPSASLQEKFAYLFTPKDGMLPQMKERITPETLTFFDPCMGSGHILVYAFEVLMEIYLEQGYSQRDAAQSILKHNLFGLDIDQRAFQLSYFALMMKGRSYDRNFFSRGVTPMVFCAVNSPELEHFGSLSQVGELPHQPEPDSPNPSLSYEESLQNWQFQLLLTRKYCAVATNPPYLNKMNPTLKSYMGKHYKEFSADLFSVFMFRNFDFCVAGGYSAFMTPFVWMFIKTYEKLRGEILKKKSISSLIQMEYSAFDEATVPICTFVLKNEKASGCGLYVRLSDFKGGMAVQNQKVLEALENKNCGYFYEAFQENFGKIPGSPIAYWVSERFGKIFEEEPFGMSNACYVGMRTGDNERFLRFWYEISLTNSVLRGATSNMVSNKKWIPYLKGGNFKRWYNNYDYVVNWKNNGHEIKENTKLVYPQLGDNLGWKITSEEHYFKEGITFNAISSGKIGYKKYDKGAIFSNASHAIIAKNENQLLYLIAFLNTIVVDKVLSLISPTINLTTSDIKKIPFIKIGESTCIENLANQNIAISKEDWDSFETSWDFKKHPLL